MKRNLKFAIKDEKQSTDLQQLLFDQGYGWEPPGSTDVKHTTAVYLYTYASGKLTFGNNLSKFTNHNNEDVDAELYLQQYGTSTTDAYDKAMQIID